MPTPLTSAPTLPVKLGDREVHSCMDHQLQVTLTLQSTPEGLYTIRGNPLTAKSWEGPGAQEGIKPAHLGDTNSNDEPWGARSSGPKEEVPGGPRMLPGGHAGGALRWVEVLVALKGFSAGIEGRGVAACTGSV